MIDFDITFLVQLINFLITLIGLNYLLIKPLRAKLKERADFMAGMLKEAEGFAARAEDKLKNYEEVLAEARKAGTEERMKVKASAEVEEQSLVQAAVARAQQELATARQVITTEADAALAALKAQAPVMAKKVADKVLA
ncbi:ATP synthase F0 subunit B [Megalodesulfovibrio gigas]|uniref:Putative H+-transporting two-sector ATPase subunit B/B n=1 Tax=Megalodesulfovibrio gigas (strain ATCC 19364 / DSM 1382 / NCIMB 9332 / VKM B-1759) TaxID=1121448 RepID=T2G8X6_MEGG1|nr:ATP synthase F0 subunit B [Megalodesulfovibrio gigas]AGW12561.1 putative H+-transporting two-sector ATPase subunit B/B' [Megalodesulfovibrio gigas DSM 1382 = ATCC 19364]